MTTPTDAVAILTEARPTDLDVPDSTIRERLYQVAISAPTIPLRRHRSPAHSYVMPVTGAVALASLFVAALALQPLHTPSPKPRPASHPAQEDTSASAMLLAAAAVVEKAPVAPVGTYWHTSMRVSEVGTKTYPSNWVDFDDWIARDPNGQSWYTMSSAHGHSPLLRAGTASNDPYHTRFDVLDRFLTFDQTQQLSAEPAALKAYLLAIPPHHPNLPPVSVSDRLFDAAAGLAEAPAPPAVRAAAFRLLAGLPGLRSLGQVNDPFGRTGIGVEDSFSADGDSVELIVDPSTGSLLALEDVVTVDGQVVIESYDALIQAGWTNTLDNSASGS